MDRKNLYFKQGELLTQTRVVYGIFLGATYIAGSDDVFFSMAVQKGAKPEKIDNIYLPENKSWKTLIFKLTRGVPLLAVISTKDDRNYLEAFSAGTGLLFDLTEINKKEKKTDKTLIVGNVISIEEKNEQLKIALKVGRGLDFDPIIVNNIFIKKDVSEGFKSLIAGLPENQTIGLVATKKLEGRRETYILDDLQIFPKVAN